ncbi:hypothetical protein RI844_12655 [Thalassotalea fonticola]|uniref:Uncharacterized protein n=1 Tax=Thalassotalea fonticola TaxID=3065649 RepID=A0ABZ0GKA3_9GAMM|nr:hypothetical protein RI844_12655 [Colwelliaceae bacterium S1-1]
MYSFNDLDDINEQLIPLKIMADKELASVRGLNGLVFTPHFDEYMKVCIKKAEILRFLKNTNLMPLSPVEVISADLEQLYKRTQNNAVVEYKGNSYQRRFTPLKLSKSGKNVQKWAKFWLLQQDNGDINSDWEQQIKEIWPQYFLIRSILI